MSGTNIEVHTQRTTLAFDVLDIKEEKPREWYGKSVFEIKVNFLDSKKGNSPYEKTLFVAAKSKYLALAYIASVSKKIKSEEEFSSFFENKKSHTLLMTPKDTDNEDKGVTLQLYTLNKTESRLIKSFTLASHKSVSSSLTASEIKELQKIAKVWSGDLLKEKKDAKSIRKPLVVLDKHSSSKDKSSSRKRGEITSSDKDAKEALAKLAAKKV